MDNLPTRAQLFVRGENTWRKKMTIREGIERKVTKETKADKAWEVKKERRDDMKNFDNIG